MNKIKPLFLMSNITYFILLLSIFCFVNIGDLSAFNLGANKDVAIEDEKEIVVIIPKTIKDTDPKRFHDIAILQSLNKITATTEELEIEVGEEIEFGKINILVHKCWSAELHKRPENKILLEIFQKNDRQDNKERIFYGWMLSSSPSISGLEHPIYDIFALKCINQVKNEDE